jgi:hypothetical protein
MIEKTILSRLLHDDDFLRKTIPFLKAEYFTDRHFQSLYNVINDYVEKYNNSPTIPALKIEVENLTGVSDDDIKEIYNTINEFKEDDSNQQWLLDETEKFCQNKAIYNAIMKSISIMDGRDKENAKGNIPDILSKALAVSFDTHIGHDFLDDYNERYDFYHKKEIRIPFDL